MAQIDIMVADDDRARRAACLRALHSVPSIRVVGSATTVREASAAAALKPHVILVSSELVPEAHGAGLLQTWRRSGAKVIVMTRRAKEAWLPATILYGARGFLRGKGIVRRLPQAIQAVDTGEGWVPRRMTAEIFAFLEALQEARPRISAARRGPRPAHEPGLDDPHRTAVP